MMLAQGVHIYVAHDDDVAVLAFEHRIAHDVCDRLRVPLRAIEQGLGHAVRGLAQAVPARILAEALRVETSAVGVVVIALHNNPDPGPSLPPLPPPPYHAAHLQNGLHCPGQLLRYAGGLRHARFTIGLDVASHIGRALALCGWRRVAFAAGPGH